MKKKEIVKKNFEFNNIIQIGEKKSNSFYSIFYISKEEKFPKFGIAVSKKFKTAVIRNKVKRQMREIIDQTKMMFPKDKNYIIIIREKFLKSTFKDKLENFKKLAGEINEKKD